MDNTLYFCTVADSRFILETFTLFKSILATKNPQDTVFFWVLCLDERAVSMCKDMNMGIKTMSLKELNDTELMTTQSSRKISEFAQTSKASFVCKILPTIPSHEVITFIDSDVYYYTDPKVVLKNKEEWSILITSHWFSESKKDLEKKVGIYNSGFICFKNDTVGNKCAQDWRRDCIEWCFNRVTETGKFTDQFYLEKWVKNYTPLQISDNKGLNIGTWNIDRFPITKNLMVENNKLICYHFHGLKLYLSKNKIKAYPVTVHNKEIYSLYIKAMQEVYDMMRKIDSNFPFRFAQNPGMLRIVKQKAFKFLNISSARFSFLKPQTRG